MRPSFAPESKAPKDQTFQAIRKLNSAQGIRKVSSPFKASMPIPARVPETFVVSAQTSVTCDTKLGNGLWRNWIHLAWLYGTRLTSVGSINCSSNRSHLVFIL